MLVFAKVNMEESPFPSPSIDNKPASKNRKRFIFLLFAVILVIALVFLGSRFLGGSSSETEELSPTPTEFIIPSDTPTPEISEEPSVTKKPTGSVTPTKSASVTSNPVDNASGIDRSELSVEVQNGSGEAGVAGKGADFLSGLGYKISSKGNADNFDYTGVTIQVKNASKSFLNLLKSDLSKNYTVSSATSDLSASSSADALVIIGK